MTIERALPLAESDLVRQERVNVLTYALLHVLASIYKAPKSALANIDGHIALYGPDSVFGCLSSQPEQFGELAAVTEDPFLPTTDLTEVRSYACYAVRFRLEAQRPPVTTEHHET